MTKLISFLVSIADKGYYNLHDLKAMRHANLYEFIRRKERQRKANKQNGAGAEAPLYNCIFRRD